jgi:HlyD family secretion protein
MNFSRYFFMKLAHSIFLSLILVPTITFTSWWAYTRHTQARKIHLFKTISPETKTITKIIDASGLIKLKDSARLGSLVSGTIDSILVEENKEVKAGQPLAIINTKDGDYSYRVALARAQQSQASLEYQKTHVARLQNLYRSNALPKDALEAEVAKLKDLEATLDVQKMIIQQEQALYEQRIIKSPIDGTVVAINISKGEPVTTELQATVLFEVAPCINSMRAFLEIDESDVTLAHAGQKIEISVDSQPHRTFKGIMQSVSYSPKGKSGNVKYEGIVDILDGQELLRPGMTAHASILVASAENALTVLNQAFFINKKALSEVAKKLKYSFHPLPRKTASAEECGEEKATKALWIHNGTSFTEREIEVGITDDTSYVVISGLTAQEKVLIDVDEANALDEIYKKISER